MPMNFNVDPYFDDYDPKKGFHKILFKPGVAVQARELTAIQSILQNQVTQFANHIFKDGSVVSGAEHFYDTNITYIKVKTDPTIDLTTLTDLTVKVNSNDNTKPDNRQFSIKHAVVADTNDPATLFVSFLDGGDTKSSNKYVSKNTTLDIYDDNILLYTLETADVDNCSGNSILFHINEGVFYTKNSFVFCPMQTIVVSKYNDVTYTGTVSASNNSKIVTGLNTTFTSSVKIGDDIFIGEFSYGLVASIESDTSLTLETESTKTVTGSSYRIALSKVIGLIPHENIITSDDDYSLLDPSYGSYNYAAPGADRYVILLEAVTKTYQDKLASSQDFIDLIHVKDGTITIDNRIPVYSTIMDSIARRTYDESGNYIVDGLLPHLEDSVNDSKLIISLSSGKAYVKGFELEKNGTTFIEVDKSRAFDSETIIVPTQYGNYITVSNFNGRLPNVSTSSTINLLNVNNVVIGTAKVVSLDVITFGTFKFYLDDIVMTKDIFSKVTSIKETSTITPTPANLYSATVTKSTIIDSSKRLLVFPVDRGNIKSINSIESITKKIYGPLNVSGGICSISTDSQYKDFSLASGSLLNNDFIVSVESSSSTNFPVGQIIDLSNMTVTVSNPYNSASSAVFDFGDSTFSGTVDIVATIFETGNLYRTKTLVENYGKEVTVSKSNVVKLGRADLYKLKAVTSIPKASDNYLGTYDSNANYPNGSIVYNNDGLYYIVSNAIGDKIPDESSDYIVNDGQTDSYYSHATIKKRKNATTDVTVLVVFDYFTHSGTGPLTVESYNSTGLNYSKLPTFVDSLAYTTYKLRNCLDYRPRQQDDSDIFDTYYFPSTSSTIVDTTFYLSRIDKLFLDKNGDFSVAQGKYAYTNVTTPANVPDAMEICSLTYEPYTDNKSNVSIQMFKNKRYTMRDIGLLESRLENVEYYTSLSALEKEASSKTFTSDNGTALFTNGFIVDSFKGKNVMDMSNPDNKCEVDFEANELRPKFEVITATLTNAGTEPTNGKTTIAIHPNTITLPYSSVELFKQTAASTAVSVNPFSIANTTGTLILTPDVDSWVYSSDTVDTPEAQQLLLGNDTTQTTQVTVWNSWKPGDATADLLSSVTNTEDFTNINAQQNKVIQGQTYSVIKLIKGSTRHNVVVAKVTGMLANATLYYFFENKLQENGWADTNGNSISTNPSSDDMGEWTGNIIIPEGYVGSTFNVMFTTSPAGKQFSNSTANSLYSIGYSLKYKDGQPLTSISSDTTGVQLPSTVIKKPKPNAVYSITPSSFTMREGQDITFTFDVQNGDPNVNYTGSCEVTGGTISSYTTKTVNGVAIGSMSNFTFRTINNKATIVIKAADDGIFQPERTFKLTVTVGHNKTPEELWPEYAYGSSYSETVKLLNPIQVQYAVTGPISVAANDTIRVNFSSINAEVNKNIKLSIKETLGDNTPTTYPFDLTSFDTNTSAPSQDIILPITENSFLERDGSYKFTFTDDSVPSVSKDISVRVVGKYSTKYFKVFTKGDKAQHFISGQQVSFNLDTNYFVGNNISGIVPYTISVDIGNTGKFVNISTLTSKFTLSSSTGNFTSSNKEVIIKTATGMTFDSNCTIKIDLTGTGKGLGESSTLYLDANKEDFILTGTKNLDTAFVTSETTLTDADVVHFTLTSGLPSAYANKTVIAKLSVSNLSANEYTMPTTVNFDSSGVAKFDLVVKGNRGTLASKPFTVTANIKNTNVNSVNLTLNNSTKATNTVSFVDDLNADVETLTTINGVSSHVKFKLDQTGLLLGDKLDWSIQAINAIGNVVNTNVFAAGSILNGTVLVSTLATNPYVTVNLLSTVPDNITVVAFVSQTSNKLNVTDKTSDILFVNRNTPVMKITTDKVSVKAGETVTYSVKSLYSSSTARSCTWTLSAQDSSSLSLLSSSASSGSFTLAADGTPQTVSFVRNVNETELDLKLILTVTDTTGSPILLGNTNSDVTLSKIPTQNLAISFFKQDGITPINSIYEFAGSTPTPVKIQFKSPAASTDSSLTYTLQSTGVDILDSTGKLLTNPVSFTESNFNAKGILIKDIQVKKPNTSAPSYSTIVATSSAMKIKSANVQIKQTAEFQLTSATIPPAEYIKLSTSSFSNNAKPNTTTINLSDGSFQNFYINSNVVTDYTYVVVTSIGNVETLLSTEIQVKTSAGVVIQNIPLPTNVKAFTDYNATTAFYYLLPTTDSSFSITNVSGIPANDKFDVSVVKLNSSGSNVKSHLIDIIATRTTPKLYTITEPDSIGYEKTANMTITPSGFASGDNHTLTFTQTGLTIGTDYLVAVKYNNGGTLTTVNVSSLNPTITPLPSGNTPITISVIGLTAINGSIHAVITSGSVTNNGTFVLKNDGKIKINANGTVSETTTETIGIDYSLLNSIKVKVATSAAQNVNTNVIPGIVYTYKDVIQTTDSNGYVVLPCWTTFNDTYFKYNIPATNTAITVYIHVNDITKNVTVSDYSSSYTISNDKSKQELTDNVHKAVYTVVGRNFDKAPRLFDISFTSKNIKSFKVGADIHEFNAGNNYTVKVTDFELDSTTLTNSFTVEVLDDIQVETYIDITATATFRNTAITSVGSSSSQAFFHYSTSTSYKINIVGGMTLPHDDQPLTEVSEGDTFWVKVSSNDTKGTYLEYDTTLVKLGTTGINAASAKFPYIVPYDKNFSALHPQTVYIPFSKIDMYVRFNALDNHKWENVNHDTMFRLTSSPIYQDVNGKTFSSASLIIKEATSPATISVTTKDTEIFEGSFSSTGALTGSVINYDITTTYLDKGTIIPIDWTSGSSNVKQVTVTSDGGEEGDLFNTTTNIETNKQIIIDKTTGDDKTFHATAKITLNADSKATNAGNVVFQVKGTNVTVPINMTPESKGLSLAATSNVKDVIGKNIVITITDDTVLQNADGYRSVIMENSTYARQFKITLNDTSISSLTFYTWTNNTNLTLEQSIKIGYDYTAKYHYSDYNTGPLMTLPNPTTGQTITVPVNGNNEFYIWVSSVYFTGNSGHVVNLKCTTTSITSNDAHVSFDITSVQASGSFYDPVAQTFYINPTDYPDGLFISKADLYFYSKPPQANIPVWIEIRPTVNGYPDSTTRISNSHVSLNQPLVNVPTSLTGTTIEPLPTTFTFTDPVYLPPGESSIIIGSTSKEYKVFVGELGQKDVTTGKLISENNPDNSVGSFFMSQNARTWTADQMKDLMFKLYRSDFDTSTELEVILDMKPETVNFTADLFHLNVPSKTFKDTSAKYAVSVTGNNIDYIDITSDNNVKLPVNTTPASTIKVKALLKSANSLLSPIIQKTMNMKLIRNLINNKSDLINLETIYSGGDADAKYITKKVTLATGFDAKGLRVLLDVNRVLGTSIEVYVKVIANEDYSDFNSKAFIQVPLKGALSYSKNDNDFVIDEYNLDNITYSTGDVNYDSFKSFIVKVVMYSDNTVNVPRVKNLRAIATS